MSFEPRIFAGGDPDSDLDSDLAGFDLSRTDSVESSDAFESAADEQFELSDDLVELAAQLTCDANHLALRYPAGQIARGAGSAADAVLPANKNKSSREYRRPAFPWRAAMAFLISGVLIWTASHSLRRNAPPVKTPEFTKNSQSLSTTQHVAIATASLGDRSAIGVAEPGATSSEDSLSSFEKLSGAEQEAVLDLLEQRSGAKEAWDI